MNHERLLRRLRNDPRLFGGDDKESARVQHALLRAKRHCSDLFRQRAEASIKRGPYSGMTRRELAQSGTCEPDWF